MQRQYVRLSMQLNERQWRLYLASEAERYGWGGIGLVARLSGASPDMISRGRVDLDESPLPDGRIRRVGGGRKALSAQDVTLEADLDALLDPKGDPMRAVQWTTKSTAKLVAALHGQGHVVSESTVGRMLRDKGFSLQANKKNVEGASHPDRDGQFHLINDTVKEFVAAGDPVISVDGKKKELLGNFRNNGKEWQPKGSPMIVNAYDFPSHADGKAVPYGVYDILHNAGFVNVGTGNDTAAFSAESIRRWWNQDGKVLYPDAHKLLITCDGGGSNSVRGRLWKKELQRLADETGLSITVRHYPPATSKWNRIEHSLFSYISINWRARPLTSLETVIELISATTTTSGLTVTAVADTTIYEKGIKVTDEEMANLNIIRHEFHGEWNYTVQKLA